MFLSKYSYFYFTSKNLFCKQLFIIFGIFLEIAQIRHIRKNHLLWAGDF